MLNTPEWTERLQPESPHELSKVRQLYLTLYQCISAGELPKGLQLPSTRALADQLSLGRNTVIAVYNQLHDEGLIEGDGRRGTRVLYSGNAHYQSQRVALHPSTLGKGLSKRSNQQPDRGRSLIALAPGMPDPDLFPQSDWRRAATKASRLATKELGYRDTPMPELQSAIARHLTVYRSLPVNPERIIVTSGTRQSLMLAASLYSDHAQSAWVESPGYRGAVDAFRLQGLRLHHLRVDEQGSHLPTMQIDDPPALIYLTPCFHYPSGAPLQVDTRRDILRFAANNNSVIFEDDYDSEFRDASQPRPALASQVQQLMASDNETAATQINPIVLHAGTFSKLLFPAARVGWVVVPESHISAAHNCLRMLGGGHNSVAQATIAELLDNGSIAKHLARARPIYLQRRRTLLEALDASPLFAPLHDNGGSLSLVAPLTKPVNAKRLMQLLGEQLLGAQNFDDFLWDQKNRPKLHALVIGVGNVSTLGIPETIERLEKCVMEAAR